MEDAVLQRYKQAAKNFEKKLCCPINYKQDFLKVIPLEILEKDYGCGDPSQYVKEGETVLDLGSGAGKLCYIISQVVGRTGKVIGVDMNDEMLNIARKYRQEVGKKLGYVNVDFFKARIQNLKLNLEEVDEYLTHHPIKNSDDLTLFNAYCEKLEKEKTLIPDNFVDVVVSNCVLNLVRTDEKNKLFQEIYRVLKDGGRAVISDIVSDKDIPQYLKDDPELWSGCISGAYREDLFLKAFEDAGFYGVEIVKWDDNPWQIVDDIEFRSVTVIARKSGKENNIGKRETVIYKGPYKKVEDDAGNIYERGKRIAVSETIFERLSREPYDTDFILSHTGIGVLDTTERKVVQSCCGSYQPFSEKNMLIGKKLKKTNISTLQINLGNLCNQACLHCHIDGSPSGKLMKMDIMEKVISFIKQNKNLIVDITGGAPELHPNLSYLIENISKYAKEIYVRTNLTALEKNIGLVDVFKNYNVTLIASLPYITKQETDYVRGDGVFETSIRMLHLLNKNGFGINIPLHIVHNPSGFCLPDLQPVIEEQYRQCLLKDFGIVFNKLFVLNNMPIGRFKKLLETNNKYDEYLKMVYSSFNPDTLNNLMCRNVLNIGYDGRLYDCDFNNALNLERIEKLDDIKIERLISSDIIVSEHCYVCTAMKGSGCYGSVV